MKYQINRNKLSVIVVGANYYNGVHSPFFLIKKDDKREEFVKKFQNLNSSLYWDLKNDEYDVLDQTDYPLYPEMQIVQAEIIVSQFKLQKRCRVVLTHSPYFLNAVEIFAEKYGVNEEVEWYVQKKDGEVVKAEHIEFLYRPLAEPLQTLEDLRWEDM